jgi:hypothetical protein
MVAEFEAHLIRMRTREGIRVAKAKGRVRGKQPKLNPRQEAHWSPGAALGRPSNRAIQRDQRRQETPSGKLSESPRPSDSGSAIGAKKVWPSCSR